MSQQKTNAMRILDKHKISYKVYSYENKDGKIDGISVAEKIGQDVKMVYKTLVTQGVSKSLYVFVIPVSEELDLKKCAKITGEKKIEMIAVKDIQKYTGYIRGGCSPIGMKKHYPTYIHESAKELKCMIVSGGKIGTQIELSIQDLIDVTDAKLVEVSKS